MFLYTFVFVSGVVVGRCALEFSLGVHSISLATILPDLAGHHFKQPYGKEYGEHGGERKREREVTWLGLGVMAEQIFKDLPKYLNRFREIATLVAGELGNRVWDLKTEIERRIAGTSGKHTDIARNFHSRLSPPS